MIKEKNGFTMLDLMMVIAIMSIFSVMAIPRLTALYSVKLFGVANKLASDIQYAQQLAISKQVRCGLSFNPGTDSYFVYEDTTATKAKDPYTRGDFIVDYQAEDSYKGVDLLNTNFGDRIEFDPLGKPYSDANSPLAANGIVVLQAQGDSRNIVIKPNTGATKVQ